MPMPTTASFHRRTPGRTQSSLTTESTRVRTGRANGGGIIDYWEMPVEGRCWVAQREDGPVVRGMAFNSEQLAGMSG